MGRAARDASQEGKHFWTAVSVLFSRDHPHLSRRSRRASTARIHSPREQLVIGSLLHDDEHSRVQPGRHDVEHPDIQLDAPKSRWTATFSF